MFLGQCREHRLVLHVGQHLLELHLVLLNWRETDARVRHTRWALDHKRTVYALDNTHTHTVCASDRGKGSSSTAFTPPALCAGIEGIESRLAAAATHPYSTSQRCHTHRHTHRPHTHTALQFRAPHLLQQITSTRCRGPTKCTTTTTTTKAYAVKHKNTHKNTVPGAPCPSAPASAGTSCRCRGTASRSAGWPRHAPAAWPRSEPQRPSGCEGGGKGRVGIRKHRGRSTQQWYFVWKICSSQINTHTNIYTHSHSPSHRHARVQYASLFRSQ